MAIPEGQPEGTLQERPEFKAQAAMLHQIIKTLSPVFDKCTEEGQKFRIYRFGSLEVRTTQGPDGVEEVGVVFSIRTPTSYNVPEFQAIEGHEKVSKATEYVERIFVGGA